MQTLFQAFTVLTILGTIFAAVFGWYSHHRDWAIGASWFAALMAISMFFSWFLDNEWKREDSLQKEPLATVREVPQQSLRVPHDAPVITNMEDAQKPTSPASTQASNQLPPATINEPIEKTMNTFSSPGSVNAPNNQGNINTGQVSGNLNQTINIGEQPRKLTGLQQGTIKDVIIGKVRGPIYFMLETASPDAEKFAEKIAWALNQAKCPLLLDPGSCSGRPPVKGVWVSSEPNTSKDAKLVVAALNAANVNAREGIPDELTNGMTSGRAQLPEGTITIWIGRATE
ncbi:hypothetical protein OAG63_00470 [Methylacidiphilales bacterium]|nr:hypothetical protein [Candidatus Methylacidiphilales bacterium]MDB4793487.1 hypothetical protein [Candidatus Methylacidiphilales bacterium]